MLLSLLGLLCFLVFAPRSALSLFRFVSYSPVSQCGPFNVSFYGGNLPAALPLTLTILPFNSTPLAFVIPNSAWDNSTNSGSFVSLLPIPAGVTLLASLDDAAGNSAALISDVIQVQPSTDTSCISFNTTAPGPFQLENRAMSQCLPFSVSRNTSSLDYLISTRGFIPTSLSFELQWTGYYENHGVDTFTYIMDVAEGLHVALLFDDGQGNRQVSDLLSVQGGRSSPSGCLRPGSAQSTAAAQDGAQRLSRPAAIAISVSSSVVILITLVLGILIIRRERRKLAKRLGAIQNRKTIPPSPLLILGPFKFEPSKPASTGTSDIVPSSPTPVDPVYPQGMFGISSTLSRATQRSTRSTILAPSTPKSRSSRSTKSRYSITRSVKSTRTKNSIKGTRARRLADLDIERLLEVASRQPAATEAPRGYPAASPHTVTPAPTLSVPPSPSPSSFSIWNPSIPRELGHHHSSPDVPLPPPTSYPHDWFTLERPPVPASSVSAVSPENGPNGLPSRIRPLSSPFPPPTVFAPSKNSA